MATFNLTNDEVDVIFELIESRLDEISGPEDLQEVYQEDINIMEELKIKFLENN